MLRPASARHPPPGCRKLRTVKVTLETTKGTIGTVTLAGPTAVPDAGAKDLLDELNIVEPRTHVRLDYESGERYLRALPMNLRGTRLWATLISD